MYRYLRPTVCMHKGPIFHISSFRSLRWHSPGGIFLRTILAATFVCVLSCSEKHGWGGEGRTRISPKRMKFLHMIPCCSNLGCLCWWSSSGVYSAGYKLFPLFSGSETLTAFTFSGTWGFLSRLYNAQVPRKFTLPRFSPPNFPFAFLLL